MIPHRVVARKGVFEKKLKKVFGGFWPRFWDHAAPPCFIGFSGNSPLRSPAAACLQGESFRLPRARPRPRAYYLPCADPPPSRPPSHCALRHLSQYVTQRATIARRARALLLCTLPAITRYVTYRNMCRSGLSLWSARGARALPAVATSCDPPAPRALPLHCEPSRPLRATLLIAICDVQRMGFAEALRMESSHVG